MVWYYASFLCGIIYINFNFFFFDELSIQDKQIQYNKGVANVVNCYTLYADDINWTDVFNEYFLLFQIIHGDLYGRKCGFLGNGVKKVEWDPPKIFSQDLIYYDCDIDLISVQLVNRNCN